MARASQGPGQWPFALERRLFGQGHRIAAIELMSVFGHCCALQSDVDGWMRPSAGGCPPYTTAGAHMHGGTVFRLHGRMYACAMTFLQISVAGRGGGRREEGRDFRLSAGVTTRVRTSKFKKAESARFRACAVLCTYGKAEGKADTGNKNVDEYAQQTHARCTASSSPSLFPSFSLAT